MVRCSQCREPIGETHIRFERTGLFLPPTPVLVNRPCGHRAGLLFDFVEEAQS